MRCTPAEIEQTRRFDTVYARAMEPAMLAIERLVCGCDFGGNSWLSRQQADDLGLLLRLHAGKQLLDLGSGSGWPAIYIAKRTGCEAVLVDLPEIGLRLAKQRADTEGIGDRVSTFDCNAANLPFDDGSFDAISHCDLLCCLVRKREVLEECRRLIRPGGPMAFTVISIAPQLASEDYRRALDATPEFVETSVDYPTLLRQTGWEAFECIDITPEYKAACSRQILADQQNQEALVALMGRDEFNARLRGWHNKLAAVRDGLVLRELFVAEAAQCASDRL